MPVPPEVDLRALDLFEHLCANRDNPRFRERLLRNETPEVVRRLVEIEAGDQARGALATDFPEAMAARIARAPERVGVFRLVERIGAGGMGEVWRAERDDGLFEQTVAVKLIGAALDARAEEAFAAERRLLARLDHPGIVRIIDGGVTDFGAPYLVMEFVQGRPFDETAETLARDLRIGLFIDVARAVQFAHGRLVAHGDIKPSNILVDGSGRARLLDFGISALLTPDGQLTAARGAMTQAYASPQRVAGAAPSIPDDVHALGVLLRSAVGQDADRDLDAIIDKARAADESHRYAAVGELISDLELWRRGFPVSARADTATYRLRRFVGRHLAACLFAGFAVAGLSGATVVATLASQKADRARAEATSRFADARSAARYLMFDLIDRLERQPNTLRLRIETADVAQRYLDRLAADALAPPDLRLETARGLIRLAEAQGVPGFQNLDHPEPARRNLDRAEALLASIPSPEAAAFLVKALTEHAHLDSYVYNHADDALKLLDRADAIIARHPEIPRIQKAQALAERADALNWLGRYDASEAVSKATLAMLSGLDDVDATLVRYQAFELCADDFAGEGAGEKAVASHEKELAIVQEAERRIPGDRRLRRAEARARWQLGAGMIGVRPDREALAMLTDAAARMRNAAALDRDDVGTQRLVYYVEADRSSVLARMGRIDEAARVIAANIGFERDQWRSHPDETQWLRDLAIDLGIFGKLEASHGRTAEGCAAFAEFHRAVNQLTERTSLGQASLASASRSVAQAEAKFCTGAGAHAT